MNKDEILKKSRAEDKNHDVYDLEVTNKGMVWGNLAACIMAIVIFIIQLIWGRELDYGLFSVLYSSFAVTHWYKWGRMKGKHELAVAVMYTLCVVIFTAVFLRRLFS